MPSGQFLVVDQAANVLNNLDGYVSAGMEITMDIALDIAEAEKDQCPDTLKELQNTMMQFADMERDLSEFRTALGKMKDEARNREEGDDINLEEILDEKLAYLQSSRKKDLSKHDKVVEFNEKVQDYLRDGEEETKPVATHIDEDIAMTQSDVNIKCPYTGQPMKHPVRNKYCNHNYEKAGILEMINLRKGRAKCPLPGCINDKPVRAEHLEDNKELKRIIDKMVRQEGKRKK